MIIHILEGIKMGLVRGLFRLIGGNKMCCYILIIVVFAAIYVIYNDPWGIFGG